MDNVQIFRHVQPVAAAAAVDIVTAVVHGKADERIMVLPFVTDGGGENVEIADVFLQCGEGGFGSTGNK